ncbi:hypothetical protein [Erwinia sp. S38]|uniref:hypothetical protein n=1 Tax=Erwinia sp. S38 TaxID=2769338 RepID=UPI0019094C9E|nr:hypothetical protein [Erwinia sp. S38]MBK0000227.1 hypothetical protein [Erwinia sp. S38]
MDILKAVRVRDFQEKLDNIYGGKNSSRTPEYIFSYLTRNSSYLSRSVLREGDVNGFFIKTLSWLFAFSTKLEINLEDGFLKKFPGICPYCTATPCTCLQTHKQPSISMPAYKISEILREKYESMIGFYVGEKLSLDLLVKNTHSIYPSNQSVWSIYGSFYHFTRVFEELGEIHEAYAAYCLDASRKINLEEEIADFTAWLFSAWEIKNPKKSLKDALIDYYSKGCPVCIKQQCECLDYNDRREAIVKEKDLAELRESVGELQELVLDKENEIKELIASIDAAVSSKSTTDAKRVLSQTKSTLDDINAVVTSASATAESSIKAAGIIKTLYQFISTFSWNN